jgi:hypothetical protein
MDTIVARIVAGYCDATIEMRVFIVRLFATRADRAPRVLSSSSLCFSIFSFFFLVFFFSFFSLLFFYAAFLGFLAKEQHFAQLVASCRSYAAAAEKDG